MKFATNLTVSLFCKRNQPILCSPFVLGGAKTLDAQAGYESAATLMAVLLAGGHFLGHSHTLSNFQQAFFMPKLFDNNTCEQWVADGATNVTERALQTARAMLDSYDQPAMDESVDEELLDYIARRESEMPAKDELNWIH